MTDVREIWECSNCDGLFWSDENCTCNRPNWNGPASQSRLTSAGFRILGPDEIDGPTLERCAAEVKHLRQLLHSQTITLDVGREDMAYFLAEDALRALKEKRT